MTTLVATDLDQTLIYSRRAIARYGSASADVAAVETYQDVESSFMTASAAATFAAVASAALIVPATTRTPEQFARVGLPGRPARWAIAANGGIVLVDGVADAAWTQVVARAVGAAASLAEIQAHAAWMCRPEWTRLLRTACDLFCYAVLERDQLPTELLAQTTAWADERGWRVSAQGRKLYWVPQALTKSAAVAEVAQRTGSTTVIAAGDSLLDADMLSAADRGIVARHGELVASGWQAEHVEVTDARGIDAGEQVVDWFAAAVDAERAASTR